MQTYYHAQVTSKPLDDCGITLHTVKLMTASEDGYQTVATIGDIQDGQSAHDLAAFWQTGGHLMLLTIFQGRTTLPSHDTSDEIIWLQKQAPAGNWVDSDGCRGPDAIEHANELKQWYLDRNQAARIVRKIIEVIA